MKLSKQLIRILYCMSLLYSANSYAQTTSSKLYVCNVGQISSGFIRIQLKDAVDVGDTVIVNSCRYVEMFLPKDKTFDFKCFELVTEFNLAIIPNFETDRKHIFYRGLYYRMIYFTTINNELYLVIVVGNKKKMKQKIDPLFNPELDNVMKLPKRGC
jgi:hypothetical protein